jgi:hypothetical protein
MEKEIKEDEIEVSMDYPLGDMVEPYDIDKEQKLTHGFGAF